MKKGESLLKMFCEVFGLNREEVIRCKMAATPTKLKGYGRLPRMLVEKIEMDGIGSYWKAWRFPLNEEPKEGKGSSTIQQMIKSFLDRALGEFDLNPSPENDTSLLKTYEFEMQVKLSIKYVSMESNRIEYIEITLWDFVNP